MLDHDALAEGEAETRAVRLRRRVGLDQLVAHLVGHPRSVVADDDAYAVFADPPDGDPDAWILPNRARRIEPVGDEVRENLHHLIAVGADQKRTYVLNYASNTISVVPSELFATGRQIPLQPLVNYRAAVLNAFSDLLGGLLQYLKDCFCDHLLVDCPTCDDDDRVSLGCVSIRDNEVYRVCNFTRRRHVVTFPKLGYWLSIVPVRHNTQR